MTTKFNPVAMYLMASYAYYYGSDPIMTDHEFDQLAVYLLKNYDRYNSHPHCPTEDDLRAGTYLGEYPSIVQVALQEYRKL
tara:strand:+ start:900 stop:1142 length:243 start_codon:yes stop_codon:yes gene_type:complete